MSLVNTWIVPDFEIVLECAQPVSLSELYNTSIAVSLRTFALRLCILGPHGAIEMCVIMTVTLLKAHAISLGGRVNPQNFDKLCGL